MDIKLYGYLLLFSALMVTAVVPIAYVLGSNISPITLMLLVSLAGTIISFVVSYLKGTLKNVKIFFTTKNGLLAMLSFGILSYTLLSLIFSYVTHYVSADLLAVIYRSWPLMLILMAPFLLRERMTKYDAIGVIVGFSSLAVILLGGTSISLPLRYLPFVFLILLGAFFDAFVSGVSKRYNYELTSSIFSYNLVSFMLFLPLAILFGSFNFSGFSSSTMIGVIILGALQNVLLTFLFVASFRTVKTSIASNAFIVSPFLTMLLSGIFLGTPIEPYYLVVAVGVVAGIMIQRMQPRGSAYRSKAGHITMYDVTSAFVNSRSERIYAAIRGESRALAFFVDTSRMEPEHRDALINRWHGWDGEVLMFTDKKPHADVQQSELDFIKDIVGAKDNHMVFVGMGDPAKVERRFTELNDYIGLGQNSTDQFGKL